MEQLTVDESARQRDPFVATPSPRPILQRLSASAGPASPSSGAPLRVGLIAPPWVCVPPTVYGGTELVVNELALGLTRAGCEVVLFTTGDSQCPVERRWLHRTALGTAADPSEEIEHVTVAYRELADVDVIHDHTLTGPELAGLHRIGQPVVTTAHGPFTSELRERFANIARSGVDIVAISHSQRRSAPELPIRAVIHHGIDVDNFPFGNGSNGYVLFLGRMHPDKGAHRAIEIAREAGKRIVIAAKMWEPAEHRYSAEVVQPMLGPDAVFVGAVGGSDKLELLAGAEALVNPIRWPEPFGLVMIEAMACGTPVVAFAEGAAPEVIEHGRSGFLCSTHGEMVSALGLVAEIDRSACRERVATHFSTTRMVDDHLQLYRGLLGQRSPRPAIHTRARPIRRPAAGA